MNRAEILKSILNNKSDISDNSARVYVATLASLAKHFDWTDVKNFTSKSKDILKYLDTLTPTRNKRSLKSKKRTGNRGIVYLNSITNWKKKHYLFSKKTS